MQTTDKIYGNCCVLSPDGILMFRCNQKKVDWYLKRELAEIVNQCPLTIKLNFTPNGLGNHEKGYGLGEMVNRCVNCGTENNLTKHHVVPISYRKYFPIEIKSHNFHDVLAMCIECHEKYERKADSLKKELSIKYDSPIGGEVINNNLHSFTKLATSLLKKENTIPYRKRRGIKRKLKEQFGFKRLTRKRLEKISKIKCVDIKKSHGEMVMEKINDINLFIEMWREHFIKNNDCKHLPKDWKIDYQK